MKFYTHNEIADMLMVSPRTIVKIIKDGKLQAVHIARRWRITEEALNDFIAARTLKVKRK